LSLDPIDLLEAAAQQAEDAWRRGDFLAAFQLYARAVSERLTNSGYGVDPAVQLQAADFIVFERLSDLARLFGRGDVANELLTIAIDQISAAGNDYWADLLRVKRIDLALGRKGLREAQSLLDEMRPSIGDVTRISFTHKGLMEWERRCSWRHATSATGPRSSSCSPLSWAGCWRRWANMVKPKLRFRTDSDGRRERKIPHELTPARKS
jgi:hypothetical protein